jgi:hypothetical protein
MLFLLLCWFLPHALFPLNLSWVVRRELYLIAFDYIFFLAGRFKTSFYLDLTFYVCLPICVQVYICQLKGWMQVMAVWSMLKLNG